MPDIDVFDFHFHCADGEGLKRTLEGGEVSGILCCTQFGVAHEEFEEKNAWLLELAAEKGKDVLPLLAKIHIDKPGWQEHAARWFETYPELVGVKLHPPASGYTIIPELVDPLFEFVNERDLCVASHTCPVPGLSAIGFQPSLKKYRDTRLIIYHASTHEETAYLATAFPNVYAEPSWLGFFPNLFQMMKKLGGHRKIMAGTDGPGWFKDFEGSPYDDLIGIVRSLVPDEETVKDVCARNAKRFLGIE